MPSQQGLGLDKEPSSASRRQEPAQSSEDCSVHGPQCRTRHLSSQDRNLVAKHDDFDCEVLLLTPREPNQLERTDESDVEEGECHAPSSSSVSRQQKSRSMGADDVFGMHRSGNDGFLAGRRTLGRRLRAPAGCTSRLVRDAPCTWRVLLETAISARSDTSNMSPPL